MIGVIVAIYEGQSKLAQEIGYMVMIIGALLQATAYSRAQMIVARVVSGVGMGAINSTVPVLQAEFSPKATRGICRFPYNPD
jgi:MFS family permease